MFNATLITSGVLNITPVSMIQESSSLQFETLWLPSASIDKLRSLLNQVPSRLFDMNTTAALYDQSTTALSSLQFETVRLSSVSLDMIRSLLNQVPSRLFDMNIMAALYDQSNTVLSSLQFETVRLSSVSLDRLRSLLNQVFALPTPVSYTVTCLSPTALPSVNLKESQQVNMYKHMHRSIVIFVLYMHLTIVFGSLVFFFTGWLFIEWQ